MMPYLQRAIAPGLLAVLTLTAIACSNRSVTLQPNSPSDSPSDDQTAVAAPLNGQFAEVVGVETQPQAADSYMFAVTVQSPDTGCEQYANWWEVVTEEGELLYRRILIHSHVDEQPFERSGGPVSLPPEQTVIVRAHMNSSGYGTQAMQGTIATGFEETTLPKDFAAALTTAAPQPGDCPY